LQELGADKAAILRIFGTGSPGYTIRDALARNGLHIPVPQKNQIELKKKQVAISRVSDAALAHCGTV